MTQVWFSFSFTLPNTFVHMMPYKLLWYGGSHGKKHSTSHLLGQKTIFETVCGILVRFPFFFFRLDLMFPLYQTTKPSLLTLCCSEKGVQVWTNTLSAIQVNCSTVYPRGILWAKLIHICEQNLYTKLIPSLPYLQNHQAWQVLPHHYSDKKNQDRRNKSSEPALVAHWQLFCGEHPNILAPKR